MDFPASPTLLPAPLTVTDLNEQVRGLLQPLREVRVEGEVSNAKISSGHLYFELKDATSRVRVTVWRTSLARIALQVRDGMHVVCTGRVDVWVQGGSYALNATRIELAGEGALWAALQRLKVRLAAEGLFDADRKRTLPFLPRVVGLATATGGAALRDMLRILNDRFPVRVILAPAKVQGEGAAESLARAVELLDGSGLCDVIIVGRGGGSIEDLWAFNEERLVRAVAACRTPIVSAVGHETDTVLTDLAADSRAPTPTAAAECVVPCLDELLQRVAQLRRRAGQCAVRVVASQRKELRGLLARLGDGGDITGTRTMLLEDRTRRLAHATSRRISATQKQHAQLRHRLHASHPLRRLAVQQRTLDGLRLRLQHQTDLAAPLRRELEELTARLRRHGDTLVDRRRETLGRQTQLLTALSPRAALRRGYAIVRQAQTGAALQLAAGVAVGVPVEVLLNDGSLDCRVEGVRLAESPESGRT